MISGAKGWQLLLILSLREVSSASVLIATVVWVSAYLKALVIKLRIKTRTQSG